MDNSNQESRPHVAMVPTPGIGHLVPIIELAKKLVHQHNFSVTILLPHDGSPMETSKKLLQSLPTDISAIFLPPVSFGHLSSDVTIETKITLSLVLSLSHIRQSLKSLTEKSNVVAFVVDLFGSLALEIANEFNLLPFIYFPTNALALSLLLHLPQLDEDYSCEYKDLPEPVRFPGCVPVHGEDLADPVQDRSNEAYRWILDISKKYKLADGILVNSFVDLEPGAFKALMEDKQGNWPKIYPVGPLTQAGSTADVECLNWLDKQPKGSVLFVCFGSGGTLSHAQLTELAIGLEMSGQRFIWIVNCPHDRAANANYFGGANIKENPLHYLPSGFSERTKEVGLLVRSWAPQAQVLNHGSTGGFMSHCGWNSILESLVNGVPIVAWPLYAEQRMNSALLAEDLKVALRVKVNENGLVGREDIAYYAKAILEGDEGKSLKHKIEQFKNGAIRALSQDGSSTKSLADVAHLWKNHKK